MLDKFDVIKNRFNEVSELISLPETVSDRKKYIDLSKEADIIAVTNNPLTDIQNIQDVVFVMNNGRIGLKRVPFDIK